MYTKIRKAKFIVKMAGHGNPRAKEYLKKVDNHKCSIDWAYQRVIGTIVGSAVVRLWKKGGEVTPTSVESYINSQIM